ncbi:MAG: patatin-like phospholipase family protein [Halioglobus sp.]|nr:patatin-like phospholipase family protein [Halioglobus sp.]
MQAIPKTFRAPILLACCVLLGACSAILRNPVPESEYAQVSVLGRQDLRSWGDHRPGERLPGQLPNDPATLKRNFGGIMHTEHNYLAISGGGADGAYGAGVLVGWSALGTRPVFTMVTGVSTGALTAPFAFLGETYDDELKMLYTTLDSSKIFFRRSIFSIVRGDSVTDNTPLMDMLKKYITDEMVAEIATEYRKGRILNIGTTDLDAGRPVIWNIGRIADSGQPGAAHLIRQILLASASIPGVFPPAYIEVQAADGKTYDEMHVDGGTSAQMFLYPTRTNFAQLREELDIKGTPTAYVIRNSRVESVYKPVKARLTDIAARSVESLIRTQGIGDAFRIAATTARDGVNLELTWIPMDAPKDPGEQLFDPAYMSALFEYGYQRAVDGTAWKAVDLKTLGASAE